MLMPMNGVVMKATMRFPVYFVVDKWKPPDLQRKKTTVIRNRLRVNIEYIGRSAAGPGCVKTHSEKIMPS